MTVTDQRATTTTRTRNPHHISTVITAWAIPLVFIGALWGAGHNAQHAGVSAFAVVAIVVIHLVRRIRRAAWNHRHVAA